MEEKEEERKERERKNNLERMKTKKQNKCEGKMKVERRRKDNWDALFSGKNC